MIYKYARVFLTKSSEISKKVDDRQTFLIAARIIQLGKLVQQL